MKKKTIVNVLLGLCTLGLAYACFWSIYEDISFDELKTEREQAVIQRLTQIRDVEEMYKQRFGYYCGDMDSIVLYVKEGKAVRGIVEEGDISDDQMKDIIQNGGLADEEKGSQRAIRRVAIQKGYITSDTLWVDVKDSLNIAEPEKLKFCPVGNTEAVIQIKKNYLYNQLGDAVDVVECRINLEDYMKDIPNEAKRIKSVKQDLKKRGKNLPDLNDLTSNEEGKWYGLRIGDVLDENNKMAGNWE